MARYLFFDASRKTYEQVTGVFDFLWPTAAAMWNLRWQVDGYLRVRRNATVAELENRFVSGSGIHGANIRRACSELSWDQQQGEFAKFLLITIFALYESWLKIVLEDLGTWSRQVEKQLQFPTSVQSGKRTGVWEAIDGVTAQESPMLKDAFYAALISHRKNALPYLDNLMKCYRYFKESRNCLIHNGGIANDKAEQVYLEFSAIANAADLGIADPPQHFPVATGAPIHMTLHGIVGFCDVVLRLIATLDAELSRSAGAEKVFHRYWVAANSKKYILKTGDPAKRKRQIQRLVSKLELPEPAKTEDIEQYLLAHRLVR